MPKQIIYGQQAKEKLMQGVDALTQAVGSTLGPRGQNVAIDRGYDAWVIHDGVNVARQIELEDPAQNLGVRLVREAANKQVDEVGDGTTVVTILAQALIREALKMSATGINTMQIRRELEIAAEELVASLDQIAQPVNTLNEKIQVATISAGEEDLGHMVGETIHKVGVDGVVTVEESKGSETYVEHQEGMQFDRGYISSYFVTDPQRMEATVEDTFVFITDRNLVNFNDIKPMLDQAIAKGLRNFVFIAPEITDNALASFIVNKANGILNILCVQAPLFEDKQKNFLQDLAVLTGGTFISKDQDIRFENVTLDMLGRAQRITATKDATLIVGGQGDTTQIQERIQSIKAQLERQEGSDFEQEKLRERIAKLTGGVSVIKVGGQTESEMKERKERAIDAVASTQAAVEQGVVPGGETVYLAIRDQISGDSLGERMLYDALKAPFHVLLKNAGLEAAGFVGQLEKNQGVDVTTSEVVDMVKQGIIDPVKVPKQAIRNAVSVAIQVMTTNTIIVPTRDKKEGESNQ